MVLSSYATGHYMDSFAKRHDRNCWAPRFLGLFVLFCLNNTIIWHFVCCIDQSTPGLIDVNRISSNAPRVSSLQYNCRSNHCKHPDPGVTFIIAGVFVAFPEGSSLAHRFSHRPRVRTAVCVSVPQWHGAGASKAPLMCVARTDISSLPRVYSLITGIPEKDFFIGWTKRVGKLRCLPCGATSPWLRVLIISHVILSAPFISHFSCWQKHFLLLPYFGGLRTFCWSWWTDRFKTMNLWCYQLGKCRYHALR